MAKMRTANRAADAEDDEFSHALTQGSDLLSSGKVIEAKDHLERAHQLQPKNEKGQNLLGLAYFKLGLFDRASEIYEMLVKENPVDPTLRVNLGLVFLKTGVLPRAVHEFEIAVDLAPEHKKAQNYLGLTLAQLGNYEKAQQAFIAAGSDQMAQKMARLLSGEEQPPTPAEQPPTQGMNGAHNAQALDTQDWSSGVPPDDAGGHSGDDSPPGDMEEVMLTPAHESVHDALDSHDSPMEAAITAAELDDASPFLAPSPSDTNPMGRPVLQSSFDPFGPPVPEEPEPAMRSSSASTVPAIAPVVMSEPPQEDDDDLEPPPPGLKTKFSKHTQFFAVPPAEPVAPPPRQMVPEPAPVVVHKAPPVVPEVVVAQAQEDLPPAPIENSEPTLVVLSELVSSARLLADRQWIQPFDITPKVLTITVHEVIRSRMMGLIAASGGVDITPEMKRFRGRQTDKPFGSSETQLMRVTGNGMLVLHPGAQKFKAIELGDDAAYFREDVVFAFEESVMFENGRVPSDVAPDLDLVHLRGTGQILLTLSGPVHSLEVTQENPVIIPMAQLVGWHGSLTPRILPLLSAPQVDAAAAGVQLTGEGIALVMAPSL